MWSSAVTKLIRGFLNAGFAHHENPATKIARRGHVTAYALAQLTANAVAVAQVISQALTACVTEVERKWHYGNLFTIRKAIERIDEKAKTQGWNNTQIGNAYRAMIEKHGGKVLLIPGNREDLPPADWYYLKRFRHVKPDEWNAMIRLRQVKITNEDQRAVDTMSTLDREAQRLRPSRYASNVEFGSLF